MAYLGQKLTSRSQFKRIAFPSRSNVYFSETTSQDASSWAQTAFAIGSAAPVAIPPCRTLADPDGCFSITSTTLIRPEATEKMIGRELNLDEP